MTVFTRRRSCQNLTFHLHLLNLHGLHLASFSSSLAIWLCITTISLFSFCFGLTLCFSSSVSMETHQRAHVQRPFFIFYHSPHHLFTSLTCSSPFYHPFSSTLTTFPSSRLFFHLSLCRFLEVPRPLSCSESAVSLLDACPQLRSSSAGERSL